MSEQISGLMDGELDENEVTRLVACLKQDEESQHTWLAYHVVGDTLRQLPALSPEFGVRLVQRLKDEPVILAPRKTAPRNKTMVALSAAASVAAVSLVALVALQVNKQSHSSDNGVEKIALAQNANPVTSAKLAATPSSPRSFSAKDNPYLIAHQEYSPSTVVEGMPSYVRTVAEVRQDASR